MGFNERRFVMALQRMPVQYLHYLQGLLLLVLHPPWGIQVDWILEKHSMKFSNVNTSKWQVKELESTGKIKQKRHQQLLTVTGPAAYIKNMNSAIFPERSPMIWHLDV